MVVEDLVRAEPGYPVEGRPSRRSIMATRKERPAGDDMGILVGWSLAAAWILFAGIEVWSGSVLVAWIFPIALAANLGALCALVVIWSRRSVPTWLQVALLVLAAVTIASRCYLLVLGQPAYGTDEIVFDQYAAQLLLFHGMNPYAHSMGPALTLFQVPSVYHTYTLTGQEVTSVSYPAGSFLLYIPALLTGLRMQAAVITDVAAWIATMFLAWRLLPNAVRWIVIPIGTESIYLGYAAGGVTDALYLPFLVLAYWRWDRFGDPTETSAARWIGPIMIGLAATIKQTPWFTLPFLVAGVAIEAHHRGQDWRRIALRYVSMAAAVFAVVNLPFLVLDPRAWVKGVMTPIVSHLIPAGQGLVGLTLFADFGGQLRFYTYASVLVVILAFAVYLGWYGTMKRVWPLLIPLAFFWPNRSFASYMVMMIPAILVAMTTVGSTSIRGWRSMRVVCAGAATALGVCLLAALALRPAVSLQVIGERSTGQLQSIDHLAVRADQPLPNVDYPTLHHHAGRAADELLVPDLRTGHDPSPRHGERGTRGAQHAIHAGNERRVHRRRLHRPTGPARHFSHRAPTDRERPAHPAERGPRRPGGTIAELDDSARGPDRQSPARRRRAGRAQPGGVLPGRAPPGRSLHRRPPRGTDAGDATDQPLREGRVHRDRRPGPVRPGLLPGLAVAVVASADGVLQHRLGPVHPVAVHPRLISPARLHH